MEKLAKKIGISKKQHLLCCYENGEKERIKRYTVKIDIIIPLLLS